VARRVDESGDQGTPLGVGVAVRTTYYDPPHMPDFLLIRSGPNCPRILRPRRVSADNRYSCC
jgi:hypothetical protein